MAIILRKIGSPTVKLPPPPFHTLETEETPETAFRASFNVTEKVSTMEPPSIDPPPSVPPTATPKAIFKILGGVPIKALKPVSEPPSFIPTPDNKSGTATLSFAESRQRWPACQVGSHVLITNSMFPWVKHYKPGDECIVESIPANASLTEDPWKYKSHLLRIIAPDSPRKGHTILLFRWEFELIQEGGVRSVVGRVISQS